MNNLKDTNVTETNIKIHIKFNNNIPTSPNKL